MKATLIRVPGHSLRTVQEWATIMEVKPSLIWNRLRRGWSNAEAVFRPSRALRKANGAKK